MKKQSPQISIIIPVYNIAAYIQRSVDSVVNQSYKNLEIILVDDGSTDDSSDILDSYAINDDRIRVIHKENGGVSSARNAGLKAANGDYIMFIDGDDRLDLVACETCLKLLDGDVDSVSFSIRIVDQDEKGNRIEGGFDNSVEYLTGNEEIMKQYLKGENLRTYARLYRRSTLGDLLFDESMRIHEDSVFTFNFLEKAHSALIINTPLYSYISRNDSAMKRFIPSDTKNIHKHYDVVTDFIINTYPHLEKATYIRSMGTLFNLLIVAKQVGDRQELSFTRQQIKINKAKIGGKFSLSSTHKLKLILSYMPKPIFVAAIKALKGYRRMI